MLLALHHLSVFKFTLISCSGYLRLTYSSRLVSFVYDAHVGSNLKFKMTEFGTLEIVSTVETAKGEYEWSTPTQHRKPSADDGKTKNKDKNRGSKGTLKCLPLLDFQVMAFVHKLNTSRYSTSYHTIRFWHFPLGSIRQTLRSSLSKYKFSSLVSIHFFE